MEISVRKLEIKGWNYTELRQKKEFGVISIQMKHKATRMAEHLGKVYRQGREFIRDS